MEADCRQQLALAKVCTGEPSAAIEEARTALAICREIGNVHMMARVAMALGYGLVDAGLYDEAIQTLERALAEIRAVADAPLLVWALEGLGLAQLAARQFDTARPFMLHMAGPMKAHVSRTGETVEGAILRIEQPRPDDKDRAAGHDVG